METSKIQGTRSDGSETHFLNVDLDVFSRSSLHLLASAFGSRVSQLYVGPRGNRHVAHFESSRSHATADAAIAALVALVKRLPRSARAVWNQASRRDFNVGIQGGSTPYSYEVPLKPETLKLVSSVNARLVLTVYGADGPAGSPSKN